MKSINKSCFGKLQASRLGEINSGVLKSSNFANLCLYSYFWHVMWKCWCFALSWLWFLVFFHAGRKTQTCGFRPWLTLLVKWRTASNRSWKSCHVSFVVDCNLHWHLMPVQEVPAVALCQCKRYQLLPYASARGTSCCLMPVQEVPAVALCQCKRYQLLPYASARGTSCCLMPVQEVPAVTLCQCKRYQLSPYATARGTSCHLMPLQEVPAV